MYGCLITRTGWHYDYVDRLCLSRALDLLEYWRRESEAVNKAQNRAATSSEDRQPTFQPEWRTPSEAEIETQFAMFPRANAMQVGVEQNVSRLPPELKDAIQWAERMKTEHGMN